MEEDHQLVDPFPIASDYQDYLGCLWVDVVRDLEKVLEFSFVKDLFNREIFVLFIKSRNETDLDKSTSSLVRQFDVSK